MNEIEKKAYLAEQYIAATKQKQSGAIDRLSTLQFSAEEAYGEKRDWQIGPFRLMEEATFHKAEQWYDPLDIGWKCGFLFNPSLLVKDEKIYMFYRAAPKKETLCSRIGLAIYDGEKWEDCREPLLYPVEDNELISVEDPKVYPYEGGYVMFYNGIYEPDPAALAKANAESDYKVRLGVDMKYATSKDLIHWERGGLVVPIEISKFWVKAAVLPKDESGQAVRIGGEYLMFISEGCGGKQYIGHSKDMLHWDFECCEYLDVSSKGHLHEVACAVVMGDKLILDFFYSDKNGQFKAGQALYSIGDYRHQLQLADGGTLSWGGLVKYKGKWTFAQGWDAKDFDLDMFLYCEESQQQES